MCTIVVCSLYLIKYSKYHFNNIETLVIEKLGFISDTILPTIEDIPFNIKTGNVDIDKHESLVSELETQTLRQ